MGVEMYLNSSNGEYRDCMKTPSQKNHKLLHIGPKATILLMAENQYFHQKNGQSSAKCKDAIIIYNVKFVLIPPN